MSAVFSFQKLSRLFLILCVGLLMFLYAPMYGFAQENPPQTFSDAELQEFFSNTKPTDSVLVATVNIYDATILKQDSGSIDVSFILSNREGIQPDVTYGVNLIKLTEAGEFDSVVESFFNNSEITLDENEEIPITFSFVPPTYLAQGEYAVEVVVSNPSGINLAFSNAGSVTLTNEGVVAIDGNSCFLSIIGDSSKSYLIDDGVDIFPTEELELICQVVNNTPSPVNLSPIFETYRRNIMSRVSVESTPVENIVSTLAPSERKSIRIRLPKGPVPQAYDVVVAMADQNGVRQVSNEVHVHYVLRGESGTIQNVLLDKNTYYAGDVATAVVTFIKSADAFPEARGPQDGTQYGVTLVEVSLHNESNNEACAKPVTKSLTNETIQDKISFPITRDCLQPVVSVKLIKEDGGVLLDEVEAHLNTQSPQTAPTTPADEGRGEFSVLKVIGIIIIIFLLVLLGIFAVRKNRTIIAILFVLCGVCTFDVHESHADTVSVVHASPWVANFTYSINKNRYKIGDILTTNVTAAYGSCSNNYKGWVQSWVAPNKSTTWTFLGMGEAKHYGAKKDVHQQRNFFGLLYEAIKFPNVYASMITQYYSRVANFVVGAGWTTSNPNANFRFRYYITHGGIIWEGYVDRSIPYTINIGPEVKSFSATPNPVPYGTSATLNWSSLETTGCTASGDWSGSKGVTGTESTGPITGQKTYTLQCTGPEGNSAPVTVNLQVSCGSQTISGCMLPQANSGVSVAGSCTAGYAGGCNASCVNGQWNLNSNSCTAPYISEFKICEPGQLNCVSSGTKSLPVSSPIEIHWNASNASFCSTSGGSGFSTGNAISGVDTATISSISNTTELYGIVCGNGGVPGVSRSISVTTYPAIPVVKASTRLVEQGTQITLTYNTAGQTCTLTGVGSVTGAGSSQVTVHAQTQYVLDCPVADAAVIVEIVSKGFET